MFMPMTHAFRKGITTSKSTKTKTVACTAAMIACAPLLPVIIPMFFIASTAYGIVNRQPGAEQHTESETDK